MAGISIIKLHNGFLIIPSAKTDSCVFVEELEAAPPILKSMFAQKQDHHHSSEKMTLSEIAEAFKGMNNE